MVTLLNALLCIAGSCGGDDEDKRGDQPVIDNLELDENQVVSSLPAGLLKTPPEQAHPEETQTVDSNTLPVQEHAGQRID